MNIQSPGVWGWEVFCGIAALGEKVVNKGEKKSKHKPGKTSKKGNNGERKNVIINEVKLLLKSGTSVFGWRKKCFSVGGGILFVQEVMTHLYS